MLPSRLGYRSSTSIRNVALERAQEGDQIVLLRVGEADAEPLVRLPADGGALRLQTMCPGPLTWQRMEELERAGAQGLMVLSAERSLA